MQFLAISFLCVHHCPSTLLLSSPVLYLAEPGTSPDLSHFGTSADLLVHFAVCCRESEVPNIT